MHILSLQIENFRNIARAERLAWRTQFTIVVGLQPVNSAVLRTPQLFKYINSARRLTSSENLGSVLKNVLPHARQRYLCFPQLVPFFFTFSLAQCLHSIFLPSIRFFSNYTTAVMKKQ